MIRTRRFNFSFVSFITSLFFLTSILSGQQRDGSKRPPMPDDTEITKMVEELSAELSLTETQETKIHSLYTDHFAEVKSSMNSGKRPSRKEMESLREEFENDVKSVLNDEQQDLYDEYVKNKRPQHGRHRQRPSNNR